MVNVLYLSVTGDHINFFISLVLTQILLKNGLHKVEKQLM